MDTVAALSPLQVFAGIMAALCGAVADRGRQLPAPLVNLIYWRLRRMARRFIALAEQVLAGTYRPAAPRATETRAARAAVPPAEYKMPHGYGGLCPLVPMVANFGGQLANLLKDPEFAALVAATPALARMLRPLLTILAVGDWPAAVPKSREVLGYEARLRRTGPPRVAAKRATPAGERVPRATVRDDMARLSPHWKSVMREAARRHRRGL